MNHALKLSEEANILSVNLAPTGVWHQHDGQLGRYVWMEDGPVLKVGPDSNGERDLFFPNSWIPVNPGDHVVFKMKAKLDLGTGSLTDGARLGIDFYDGVGNIGGSSSPHGNVPQSNEETIANYVHWGTSDFTQRVMDFNVQGTVNGKVPMGMIPWLQVTPWSEPGYAYFRDVELYVNPSGVPSEGMQCPICQAYPFPGRGELNAHISAVHSPGSPGVPSWVWCEVCGAGPFIYVAEYDLHKGTVHKVVGGGSPMWVATECGLDQVSVDRLRVLGHGLLPQSIVDVYHVEGEDFAVYLRSHPLTRAAVKWVFEKVLSFLG